MDIKRQEYELAKKRVSFSKSLKALKNNPDFINLIEKGYLDHYLKTLVTGSIYSQDARAEYLNSERIRAISYFEYFLKEVANYEQSDLKLIKFYENGEE